MKVLITICARGGSKGIPGKNVKVIGGKPLIAYTIATAKKLQDTWNCDIGLSTDALDIRDSAKKYGLDTDYIRPSEMATDNAGKLEVIKSLMAYHESFNNIRYDFVIDMDVTSPLRNAADVIAGLQLLEDNSDAINLFSVNKAHRNPYFNMVEEDGNGYYKLVKQGQFLTRQSAPKVYDLNASFYVFKRHFFDADNKTINDKSLVYEMPHMCFDLDEPVDFEFMQYLIENDKLGFQL